MHNKFNEIEELEGKIQGLKEDVLKELKSLAQNNVIKRLNSNCFVIQFKDLDNRSWLPGYYDFSFQYDSLVDAVKRRNPQNLKKYIEGIIKDKVIPSEHYSKRILLHPKVIENIKALISA